MIHETDGGNWACAACGGAVAHITRRGKVDIGRCRICGLIMGDDGWDDGGADVVSTAPAHFTMLRDDLQRHTEVSAALIGRRLGLYARHLGGPPEHWLEVGPGNGVLSDILKGHGCSWLGVEYDADMASAMQAEGKAVIHADFAAIRPETLMSELVRARGGFDMVTFSQVLEHVRHADMFLANAFASLRPGGLLHLDVPNDAGLTASIRRANPFSGGYGEIVPPHHMIAYSPHSLRRALTAAGFDILDLFSCRYDHPVFGLAHSRMGASARMRTLWRLSGVLGMGGNLVALARKPLGDRDSPEAATQGS